jgi:Holliday junction resolvase RusA-like endonuclease
MNFILEGIIPSKKNSRRMIMRGGKKFSVPSIKHEQWVNTMRYEINIQKAMFRSEVNFPIKAPVKIDVRFGSATKRKWDLSNKFESIADLLVDTATLSDDNYTILRQVNLSFDPSLKEDIAYVNIELLDSNNE